MNTRRWSTLLLLACNPASGGSDAAIEVAPLAGGVDPELARAIEVLSM